MNIGSFQKAFSALQVAVDPEVPTVMGLQETRLDDKAQKLEGSNLIEAEKCSEDEAHDTRLFNRLKRINVAVHRWEGYGPQDREA